MVAECFSTLATSVPLTWSYLKEAGDLQSRSQDECSDAITLCHVPCLFPPTEVLRASWVGFHNSSSAQSKGARVSRGVSRISSQLLLLLLFFSASSLCKGGHVASNGSGIQVQVQVCVCVCMCLCMSVCVCMCGFCLVQLARLGPMQLLGLGQHTAQEVWDRELHLRTYQFTFSHAIQYFWIIVHRLLFRLKLEETEITTRFLTNRVSSICKIGDKEEFTYFRCF